MNISTFAFGYEIFMNNIMRIGLDWEESPNVLLLTFVANSGEPWILSQRCIFTTDDTVGVGDSTFIFQFSVSRTVCNRIVHQKQGDSDINYYWWKSHSHSTNFVFVYSKKIYCIQNHSQYSTVQWILITETLGISTLIRCMHIII